MYSLLKPILFLFGPERAHLLTTRFFKFLMSFRILKRQFIRIYDYRHPRLEREVFGIKFRNPVGLAAGFDKNADLVDDFSHLGFGFIEVGTVTPKPQHGNRKPRLFRLIRDRALINRMGFNNEGAKSISKRLENRRSLVTVGGNIGKNKATPNEDAINDYLECFHELYDHVDYFVVNISSPNTPGLRDLQEKEPLRKLLSSLIQSKKPNKPRPILLKIAPDLSYPQLDDVLEVIGSVAVDGLIVSNTTIDHSHLLTSSSKLNKIGAGGLSGEPVFEKSTEQLRYIRSRNASIPIIAVGGISSPERAIEKLKAGADLIQIYTGLIYEGPALVKRINKAIVKHLN